MFTCLATFSSNRHSGFSLVPCGARKVTSLIRLIVPRNLVQFSNSSTAAKAEIRVISTKTPMR
jgi:hypothetical protein